MKIVLSFKMKSPIHGLHELVVAVNSLMKSVGIVIGFTSGSYLNKSIF